MQIKDEYVFVNIELLWKFLQKKQQNCYQTKKSFLKKNRNKKVKKHKAKKGFKKNKNIYFLWFSIAKGFHNLHKVLAKGSTSPWHMKQNNININNAME